MLTSQIKRRCLWPNQNRHHRTSGVSCRLCPGQQVALEHTPAHWRGCVSGNYSPDHQGALVCHSKGESKRTTEQCLAPMSYSLHYLYYDGHVVVKIFNVFE